jgi:hypothetical protein
MVDVEKIESRAELTRASSIQIGTTLGGIQIATPADLEILSLRLARGGVAVPPHVRNNAGVCFALCLQALEWRFPIMSVINKSFVVSNKGVERIGYESQLLHAVVEQNAPLKGRLRHEIIGIDDERRCKVWGTFKREKEPHIYISETLGKLREARGRNEQGVIKGSPLWDAQPEVQLFYSSSRQWARLFCPDVLLGTYTPDELGDAEPEPTAVSSLSERLRAAKQAAAGGFDISQVARESGTILEGEAIGKEAFDENPEVVGGEPEPQGGEDGDGNRGDDNRDEGRRNDADSDAGSSDREAPGQAPAPASSKDKPARRRAKGKQA